MKCLLFFTLFLVSLYSFGQSLYPGSENRSRKAYDLDAIEEFKRPNPETGNSQKNSAVFQNKNFTKNTNTVTAAFTIVVERTNYDFHFNKNNSGLTADLKERLTRFMKNTTRSEFKGIGTFYIDVIKKEGQYYILTDSNYNNQLPL